MVFLEETGSPRNWYKQAANPGAAPDGNRALRACRTVSFRGVIRQGIEERRGKEIWHPDREAESKRISGTAMNKSRERRTSNGRDQSSFREKHHMAGRALSQSCSRFSGCCRSRRGCFLFLTKGIPFC